MRKKAEREAKENALKQAKEECNRAIEEALNEWRKADKEVGIVGKGLQHMAKAVNNLGLFFSFPCLVNRKLKMICKQMLFSVFYSTYRLSSQRLISSYQYSFIQFIHLQLVFSRRMERQFERRSFQRAESGSECTRAAVAQHRIRHQRYTFLFIIFDQFY